jgi:PmbA protein
VRSREAQLYALPDAVESRRSALSEHYVAEVLRQTTGPDGRVTCGSGNTTLLPGDDIGTAIDAAVLMAGLVHNQPYSVAEPAAPPDVPLADPLIQTGAAAALDGLLERLRSAVAMSPHVRLTAAEFFAEERRTHIRNSRGVDAVQTETLLDLEWVLLCRDGDQQSESFVELRRRRMADIDIEAEVAARAGHALDLLAAGPAPDYRGAVVLRGEALAVFLNGGVLQTLASAATKFSKLSHWQIGQPIFGRAGTGEPLRLFANRRLPFGAHANRFDDEGLPAQRVELIRDNRLVAFIASQRYAEYLGIPPTGDFGDIELPAGSTLAGALMAEPYLEVVAFSWFNPDQITGDFSSEIRLGYLVEGGRCTPFKGGALVGNVLDALANARWSAETGFYGDYQGPTTARFEGLRVAGSETPKHKTTYSEST